MAEFEFHVPACLVFGADSINTVGARAGEFGSRALLITESVLYDGGHVEKVRDILRRKSIDCIVYDELSPGSTSSGIDEIVQLARASQSQVIIGMGGMRVLSAARCTASAAATRTGLTDLLSGQLPNRPPVPYIEIPSSYRNHFMLKHECVITDDVTRHARVLPLPVGVVKYELIDPNLTLSLSPKYAAAVMLDSLLAAIEGYLSTKSTFLSDTLFLRAIDMLKESIEGIGKSPNDMRHRLRAAEGGLMSAIGLGVSSQGAGGALSYAINARYNVPKSWIATALLPHILDQTATVRPVKTGKVARALGEDIIGINNAGEAGQASVAARRLLGLLGLPGRLREFDLSMDEMYEVCETAASFEMITSSPMPLGAQDLFEIVKQAF